MGERTPGLIVSAVAASEMKRLKIRINRDMQQSKRPRAGLSMLECVQ